MTTHLGVMTVFALLTATVFAVLLRDEAGEQVRIGVRIFAGLVGGAILLGWLMFGVFR